MFKEHTSIFATFDAGDSTLAGRKIAELERRFPGRKFSGRHLTHDDREAERAISASTLTLVLETAKTHKSREVAYDIRISLTKVPPNEILRILLTCGDEMPTTCKIATMLSERGVDVVSADPSTIDDALHRLDLLGRHEPKLKRAVETGGYAGNCNRN